MMKLRIRSTDTLGNVSYLYSDNGVLRCALANGMGASLFYAGVPSNKEMEVRFTFEDATTPREFFDYLRELIHPNHKLELMK